MKKKYFLPLCFLLTCNHILTFAEDQISIFISPGISFGHVHTNPDNVGFQSNKVGFGGKIGALYDWNIKNNYYLCSGLVFVLQQVGFENGKKQTHQVEEQHKIEYLQVPILLKLSAQWRVPNFAKNFAIFVGYFYEKKIRQRQQKVAKLAKFRHIWSHCLLVASTMAEKGKNLGGKA